MERALVLKPRIVKVSFEEEHSFKPSIIRQTPSIIDTSGSTSNNQYLIDTFTKGIYDNFEYTDWDGTIHEGDINQLLNIGYVDLRHGISIVSEKGKKQFVREYLEEQEPDWIGEYHNNIISQVSTTLLEISSGYERGLVIMNDCHHMNKLTDVLCDKFVVEDILMNEGYFQYDDYTVILKWY